LYKYLLHKAEVFLFDIFFCVLHFLIISFQILIKFTVSLLQVLFFNSISSSKTLFLFNKVSLKSNSFFINVLILSFSNKHCFKFSLIVSFSKFNNLIFQFKKDILFSKSRIIHCLIKFSFSLSFFIISILYSKSSILVVKFGDNSLLFMLPVHLFTSFNVFHHKKLESHKFSSFFISKRLVFSIFGISFFIKLLYKTNHNNQKIIINQIIVENQ